MKLLRIILGIIPFDKMRNYILVGKIVKYKTKRENMCKRKKKIMGQLYRQNGAIQTSMTCKITGWKKGNDESPETVKIMLVTTVTRRRQELILNFGRTSKKYKRNYMEKKQYKYQEITLLKLQFYYFTRFTPVLLCCSSLKFELSSF